MSIRLIKKGVYAVEYYVIDTVTGKRHHLSKRAFSLKEAKEIEAGLPTQQTVTISRKKLGEMFEEFISTCQLAPGTLSQSRYRFKTYVTLKDKPIDKIKKCELVEWANSMRSRPLSNATINKVYGLVKQTYKYANDIYDIPNISKCIKSLRVERKEKEILTPQEFNYVVSFEKNPVMYAFFYTAYWSSCRRGELKALYKTDLVDDTLYIRRSMRLGEDSMVDHLKNGSSLKTIKLDQDTLNVIKPLAEREGKYMFGDDECLTNTTIERHWDNCMAQSKIPKHVTFHGLRHSSGSALLDAGLDLASVSKRLGHKSISTTANVYSHVLDKTGQKSVNVIDQIKNRTLRAD